MRKALAGDQALLRRLNRTAVIRLVWSNPGISRSEVALQAGLTKSSVGLLAQELIQEGWFLDGAAGTGSAPGRPSIPLFINTERFALIGVDIDVKRINAVSIDLYGNKLATQQLEIDNHNLNTTISQSVKMITGLHQQIRQGNRKLLGVGVGVPGAVNLEQGLLKTAPNLGWSNIPLQHLLAERLPDISQDRVHVDNDANLGVLAEYLFGQYRESSDLLYIRVAYGIGGGLLQDHKVYRGGHGFAGEVGHISLMPHGPKCSCGNRGCAETLCSLAGILRAVQKATKQALGWDQVLEHYRMGEPKVVKVMQHAATYLGMFVSNLVNTLDPETVIVGGPVAQLGEVFFEQANRELQRRMFGNLHRSIEIVRSTQGTDDCAIGAAGFAWQTLLETMKIDEQEN